MKNIIVLFVAAFVLVFSAFGFAGEGSDTIGDENVLIQLRYSYSEYDYKSKWEDDLGFDNDFDFSGHSGYLQVDYGITDFVDIYGLLGYKYLNADEDRYSDYGLGEIDSILWGVGLKGTFYRMDNGLYVGGGLGVTHSFNPGETKLLVDGDLMDYDYNEFNVTADLHVGWKIKKIGLTPYIGAEYRYTRLFLENLQNDPTGDIEDDNSAVLYDDDSFGMYVGLDYYLNNRLYVNVEGHFYDYTGVSASVGYLFDSLIPNLSYGGTGSDTVGRCRLLPQVRYSYIYNNFDTGYEGFYDPGSPNEFEFENQSVYFQLTYGLTDYVDVYGLIGYRNIRVDIDAQDRVTGDMDALLWGAGLKSTFYRADNGFYVGGGLELMNAVTPTWEAISNNDSIIDVIYREMNLTADLHAGWHFEKIGLTPYVGVEYRYTVATLEEYDHLWDPYVDIDDDDSARFTQNRYVGVFAGVTYLIADRLYLNVEGHAIDYWGGSVGVGYMFDICGRPAPVPPAPAPTPAIEPKLEPMGKL